MKIYIATSVLTLAAIIFLYGCGSAGTGLSQNERYLRYLENTESIAGFVLLGTFYELPEPLSAFVNNGWELSGEAPQHLAAGEAQVIDLTNADASSLAIWLRVNNSTDRNIPLLDASVTVVSMNNVAKNEVVALGGITGNTARRDVIEVLGDRDFGESRHGGIMLTKFFESEHEGAAPQEIITERVMQNLDLWLESGAVSGITVEIQVDRITSRIEYTEEQIQAAEAERAAAREVERDARAAAADEAERQAFIESAHHHEGVVVGIYSEHFAFDTHSIAGRDGIIVIDRRTEALRELDGPGWFMAINTRALNDDFDIATIQAGDIIAVWTDTEGELIRYEDEGQLIPYVTAGILVVNDLHTYDRQGGW